MNTNRLVLPYNIFAQAHQKKFLSRDFWGACCLPTPLDSPDCVFFVYSITPLTKSVYCKTCWNAVVCFVLGGLVAIVMRENFFETVAEYKDCLEPLMKQLDDEGKWRC